MNINKYLLCRSIRLNEWCKKIHYFELWINWLISKDFQHFYQQRKCVSIFCTCYFRQSGSIFAYNIFANFYVLCCCTLFKTLKGHSRSRKNDEIIDDSQTITIWWMFFSFLTQSFKLKKLMSYLDYLNSSTELLKSRKICKFFYGQQRNARTQG